MTLSSSDSDSKTTSLLIAHDADQAAPTFGEREQRIGAERFFNSLSQMALLPSTRGHVGAYVHLPFCPTRCISCDRVATVSLGGRAIDVYLDALEHELSTLSSRFGHGWYLDQLLIGGGTPNYLSDTQLVRLMNAIEQHFKRDAQASLAMECNPSRTSHTQMQLLAGLGFDELRFELRELDPRSQFGLGRSCSPELLADAFDNARSAGIAHLSVELNYGLPGQTRESIRQSLGVLLDLNPDRVVCAPFIRQELRFTNQRMLNPDSLPGMAEKMGLFMAMVEVLEARGFIGLDISTFVRKEDPLVAAQEAGKLFRNRLGYTSRANPWVIGFGAGAISELPNLLSQNDTAIDAWQADTLSGKAAVRRGVVLSDAEARERAAITNLSAQLSVNEQDFTTATGLELLDRLRSQGFVESQNGQIRVTGTGRQALPQFWNEVASDLRWLGECG